MKRFLFLAFIVLFCSTLSAQNSVNDILTKFASSGKQLCCKYNYTLKGSLPLSASGSATVFGAMYYTSENGLEYYCNGTTLWAVDQQAKEVVVSNADASLFSTILSLAQKASSFNYTGDKLTLCIDSKELSVDFSAHDILLLPPPGDSSAFVFDSGSLDSSWIITDLR